MRHKVPELELSEILLLKKIKIFNYMKDAGSEGEVTKISKVFSVKE